MIMKENVIFFKKLRINVRWSEYELEMGQTEAEQKWSTASYHLPELYIAFSFGFYICHCFLLLSRH